ncbi:undecaprenyl-diphosphate phosphatase [Mariniluteicoccus endophyticus]
MNWLHAILLGIVEGLTEFLPVSSTGHLTVVEKLLGYRIDDPGITAFTAVIQMGAIIAAVIYFWSDIVRLATAFFAGVADKAKREEPHYRLGLGVIVATIPIVLIALALSDLIEGAFRSMWAVAGALIVWSFVMWLADRVGKQERGEATVGVKDSVLIGLAQCIALVPGVSRSGATISAGLLLGLDRVTATRMSFFLGIPALLAGGTYQAVKAAGDISATVGWGPTAVATVVSFVVGYASIAWLLKFVASNNFTGFVVYRVLLGLGIFGLLAGGIITAH